MSSVSDQSPAGSPRSVFFDDENVDNFPLNGLCLELPPFRLERTYDYEAGGHHPVHLGDLLGDGGRFRVIHKLGHGGFANVWLCRDTAAHETTKYVALKILMGDVSGLDSPELRVNKFKEWHNSQNDKDDGADSICLPLDQFKIHGPNGDHLCFVYPVLGPKVSLGLFHLSKDPDSSLRGISFKTTKAVGFLHSHGICHGDLTPDNILHRILGLDGLLEDEVLRILGKPTQNRVLRGSKPHDEPTAPQYLVYPVNWHDVDRQYIGEQPCIVDFGESFEISQPPEDLGIPGPYRSPELILEKSAGLGSDLWALGCTLFEIRTGRKLFATFDDDEDNAYLDAMVQVLGRLPEPWWSTTWEDRRGLYADEVDEHGRAVAAGHVATGDGSQLRESGITSSVHPSIAPDARSLLDKLAPGLWYMDNDSSDDCHRPISQREKEIFVDLLNHLLEYKPRDRISAKAALKHKWFTL